METKLTRSSIMMIIGMFFVILAGGIFVTSSWGDFTPLAKEIALCSFMVFFFAGKLLIKKMFDLPKTESCLFYLGVVFASFLVYTIVNYNIMEDAIKALSVSIFVAFLFCFIRFIISKNFLDFIFSVIILDVFAVTLARDYGKNYNVMLIVWALVLIFIAVLYKIIEKGIDKNKLLNKVFKVVTYIQMIFISVCIVKMAYNILIYSLVKDSWFLQLFADTKRFLPMVFVIPFMFLALLIATHLQDTMFLNAKAPKIVLICFMAISFVYDLNRIIKLNTITVIFAIFVAVAIWQIIKPEKAIMVIATCFAFILEYAQFYNYGTKLDFTHYSQALPFLALLGIVWIIEGCKKKDKGYLVVGICQLAVEAIKVVSITLIHPYDRYSFAQHFSTLVLYMAIVVFIIAIVMGQFKSVFNTIGLCLLSLGSLLSLVVIDLPKGLGLEWFAFSILIPVLAIAFIWRKNKEFAYVISIIAVYFTTLLLFVHNTGDKTANVACTIIFIAYLTILIIVGIIYNDKKNWIVHLVVLVFFIIYVTRNLWTVLPWWVFFVIIGLVFIAVAIFLEKRDKNKKNIEEQPVEEVEENK